jgi:hypothetical protein
MNETTPVLDENQAISTSTEKEPNAAEYDVRVAADASPHSYKVLTRRPARPNFMDFFAPRRRQPADPAVPRYTALAEPPADFSEAESPATPEILEASPDQSSEEISLTAKG